ncbi:uncharacterized protein LOC117100334 [Anneissia japonica]|uniref:uncharacterized protein LOC117100334 n=1 Tax=Anneissia japonica TaxID=1529436 RepID=UPI00142584E4|nr:uncharacterized protein LOC117100334 [Anneissia japonica]
MNISVSEEFNDIKVRANSLVLRADVYKQQAQVGISKCIANASDLNNSRNYIKKQINETVEEMVKLVRKTGKPIEAKVDDVCKTKDKKSNFKIDELNSTILDVEKKQDSIVKLLKSGEATNKTCQQAITELQEKIAVLPETEPRDDGKIYFYSKKDQMLSYLEKQEIGSVSVKPNENTFEILCENPMTVTCYQHFLIEIAQRYKCEIDIEEMTVSTGNTLLKDPQVQI